MIKEAIGTGASIEEARIQAVERLQATENDDIQFEVLSTPKKKVMGIFGGVEAQVRAFVEYPDPIEKPKAKTVVKAKETKKTEKTKKASKTTEKQPVDSDKKVASSNTAMSTNADVAVSYLSNLLELLGCTDITVDVDANDDFATISVHGKGLGVAIGRRGETLDAIQYLTSLAASPRGSKYYKIVLDIENYRTKREKSLKGLALRTANQVLRTGKVRSLEPMNPYERRIIHTSIQELEGVSSHSVGDAGSRHVLITPDKNTSLKNEDKNDNSPSTESPDTAQKKSDAYDLPLYGKISK